MNTTAIATETLERLVRNPTLLSALAGVDYAVQFTPFYILDHESRPCTYFSLGAEFPSHSFSILVTSWILYPGWAALADGAPPLPSSTHESRKKHVWLLFVASRTLQAHGPFIGLVWPFHCTYVTASMIPFVYRAFIASSHV